MKKILPFLMGRYLNGLAQIAPAMAGSHGFRLFCFPFRPPLRPHQKEFLRSGAYRRLRVDDWDVQVYKWGGGDKKILFLHGWQSHTYRWKNFIEAFPQDEYTLYSLDAPGHGLSGGSFLTVPVYGKIIASLFSELKGVDAIVAHSLGAFTSLYTVSQFPALHVEKLVLLAPPGEASEFVAFYKKTLNLSDTSLGYIKKHFEATITHPVEFFSAPRFAASIRKPGLIIHDTGDDETPHHHSIAIHESWPESELVITHGLGHNLKSVDIIQKVKGFIIDDDRKNVVVDKHPSATKRQGIS